MQPALAASPLPRDHSVTFCHSRAFAGCESIPLVDHPARFERKLPAAPQIGPYVVQVTEGTRYRWCSCGLSRTQPWCDGAHVGTGLEPIEFEAPVSGEFHMCGCKRSDNKPYCFGNCRGHQRLLGGK